MNVMIKRSAFIVLLIFLLFLPSCKYATVIDYFHEETEGFYKQLDIDEDKLIPYKIHDVLFAPYFIGKSHTHSLGGLRMYSKSRLSSGITVDKVILYKNSEGDDLAIKKIIEQEVAFDKKYKDSDIYHAVMVLFDEIDDSTLETFSRSGQFRLALYCSVKQGKKTTQKRIEYVFHRREREFWIGPT